MPALNEDYPQIEKAILFLEQNFRHQPELHEVAKHVNLSEYHFQRVFRRWVGISPKRFVQFLTVEYAKKVLEESRSVLEATYDSGLSSPGRLHDLFVNVEAVTPGEYKLRGDGLKISYGFHSSPFGECLLAVTERGICGLGFVGAGGQVKALADFKSRWSEAKYEEDSVKTRPFIDRTFNLTSARSPHPLTLLLVGTNFQIKVWQALLRIPPGSLVCYEDLARRLGQPNAARAVGSAVGQNPISFIIPCHRVIRKIGITGDYHWGAARKKAMLAWEVARTHEAAE